MITNSRAEHRARVKRRVRKKVFGTTVQPRLTVYRSLNHLYAQIVDDSQSKTLVAVSTLAKELKDQLKDVKGQKEIAKFIGTALAKKATAQKLKKVVFDRNGYRYHGIVKSLADGARSGGLEF